MTTPRKTYRVLNNDVHATVRDELEALRATHGTLTRPQVLHMAGELGVAERTVWRFAEHRDADGRCQGRARFT